MWLLIILMSVFRIAHKVFPQIPSRQKAFKQDDTQYIISISKNRNKIISVATKIVIWSHLITIILSSSAKKLITRHIQRIKNCATLFHYKSFSKKVKWFLYGQHIQTRSINYSLYIVESKSERVIFLVEFKFHLLCDLNIELYTFWSIIKPTNYFRNNESVYESAEI